MNLRKFSNILLSMCLVLGVSACSEQSEYVDKPFPEMSAKELFSDSTVDLPKQLNGKVSLVNVWASWCGKCRKEHNRIIDLSKRSDVLVIGIDFEDTVEDAKEFLKELGNPFAAVAFDPDGVHSGKLGFDGTPGTVIVDKQGVVRYHYKGEVTDEMISGEIIPLIEKLNTS